MGKECEKEMETQIRGAQGGQFSKDVDEYGYHHCVTCGSVEGHIMINGRYTRVCPVCDDDIIIDVIDSDPTNGRGEDEPL
jgi:hypothetical protein